MDKKRTYLILLGIALAIVFIAIIAVLVQKSSPPAAIPETDPSAWIAASSTEPFIAYFPGRLEKRERELPTPQGTFVQQSYTAGNPEKAIFTVVTTDYKVDLEGADQTELLKAALEGMVQSDEKNRLAANAPNVFLGRQSLDFEIQNLGSGVSYRGTLVIRKSSLYQLFVSYIGEGFPEKDYKYFMESFEFKK